MDNLEKATKEWEAVGDWVENESIKLTERLKREGRWEGGLDGNRADFAYISQTVKKKAKGNQRKIWLIVMIVYLKKAMAFPDILTFFRVKL